ncbi:MAG TPA: hypothetical protein VGL33_30520 [Streptosporangiaceae bacterium]|jgi:hypothetical protein
MTDLEVYQPKAPVAIAANGHQDTDSWITVVRDIIRIADVIYDTPFVPDGLRGSSPAVAAAMLAGREMGLGIMTSLANIDVIRGKPTQKALLMRAMILSRGHKWQDVDVTDSRAVVRGCRKGESEWTEVTFTDANAKRAGIDLGKYPADKLYARATSRLARRKFADVIMGMPYSAEEMEDGEADEGTIAEPAASNGAAKQEAPKPAARTARRKTAAAGDDTQGQRPAGNQAARPEDADDSTAQDAIPRAAGAAPSRGAQPLPPLPGEDDETPAAAGLEPGEAAEFGTERHQKVIGIVWAHLKRLGYPDDKNEDDKQRAARLADTAKLANVSEIGSTSDLDLGELSLAADTLAKCKNRAALDAILGKGQKAGDGDE